MLYTSSTSSAFFFLQASIQSVSHKSSEFKNKSGQWQGYGTGYFFLFFFLLKPSSIKE